MVLTVEYMGGLSGDMVGAGIDKTGTVKDKTGLTGVGVTGSSGF